MDVNPSSNRVAASGPQEGTPTAAKSPKAPKIFAPLSVLTARLASVPLRDMEQWVNRPADVRHSEVQRRQGHITRPMNSFMLYRMAYAARTMVRFRQNNPQVVSTICGQSWRLEPDEVRKRYKRYAETERTNHKKAHPTYKFVPKKDPKRQGRREKPSPAEGAQSGSGRTNMDCASVVLASEASSLSGGFWLDESPTQHGVGAETGNGWTPLFAPTPKSDLCRQETRCPTWLEQPVDMQDPLAQVLPSDELRTDGARTPPAYACPWLRSWEPTGDSASAPHSGATGWEFLYATAEDGARLFQSYGDFYV